MKIVLRVFLICISVAVLSCGSSSDSSDGSPSTSQCETTCTHIYEDCELALVDSSGESLTQSDCETSCLEQEGTLVDCLEEVECTETAIDTCLSSVEDDTTDTTDDGSTSSDNECDSDSDCSSSNNEECVSGTCVEQECNSDSDCGSCEYCSSGQCYSSFSPGC